MAHNVSPRTTRSAFPQPAQLLESLDGNKGPQSKAPNSETKQMNTELNKIIIKADIILEISKNSPIGKNKELYGINLARGKAKSYHKEKPNSISSKKHSIWAIQFTPYGFKH